MENGNISLMPCSSLPPPASPPQAMSEPAPNPELLGSLGRLVRGLSALFWGLPLALVICVQTARGDWFDKFAEIPRSPTMQLLFDILPSFSATALLFYGLDLLGHFQKQERVWRLALDRAKVFSLINLGFSPFLFWWKRMPSQPFYNSVVELMMLSSLLFLFALNPVLWRLAAMLPDETLRLETRLFTAINRYLILFTLLLLGAYFMLARVQQLPPILINLLSPLEQTGLWLVLILVLLPVAMTMALIWKIKEIILASVFGPGH